MGGLREDSEATCIYADILRVGFALLVSGGASCADRFTWLSLRVVPLGQPAASKPRLRMKKQHTAQMPRMKKSLARSAASATPTTAVATAAAAEIPAGQGLLATSGTLRQDTAQRIRRGSQVPQAKTI